MNGVFPAALAGGDLIGAGGDDLVGVHVGRGPAAGLEDVDDELLVELPVDDLLRRLLKQAAAAVVEHAELMIHLPRRPFDQSECRDESSVKAQIRDGKILHRPRG